MTTVAMPEWLTRQDIPTGAWTVQEGPMRRGEAWTNIHDRRMRVPFGEDEVARLVRAHEMMHAKVSPVDWRIADTFHVTQDAARVAEEFRVNTLCGVAGFPIENLRDGSEVNAGKRDGEVEDWNGMVMNITACAGSVAAKDYIRGMKTTNPTMAASAREIEKAVIKTWTDIAKRYVVAHGRGRKALTQAAKEMAAQRVGDTTPHESGAPTGFVTFTVPLARLVDNLLRHPDGSDDGSGDENFDGDGGIPDQEEVKDILGEGERGRFARMILDRDLVLGRRVDGRLGRKRVPANIGRNPRRIHRMLVDPERRVFDRKVRGKGGIILIDQSGSMDLSEADLWSIIEQAPGCTIIGYSHKAGSTDRPNVWILAERGKVIDDLSNVPQHNMGNGVDGPAIRFAASKRRSGESFIWVCDGMVTDGQSDGYYQNLGEQCARLVIKHGIHMVENVKQAVESLQQAAKGSRLHPQAVGYIRLTETWRGRGESE